MTCINENKAITTFTCENMHKKKRIPYSIEKNYKV